jgi:hypothetical protein
MISGVTIDEDGDGDSGGDSDNGDSVGWEVNHRDVEQIVTEQ